MHTVKNNSKASYRSQFDDAEKRAKISKALLKDSPDVHQVIKLNEQGVPEFYSQAGQDRFVFELLYRFGVKQGSFLDLGCHDPVSMSNTFTLEQLGWGGVLMDCDQHAVDECKICRHPDRTKVILANTVEFDWGSLPDKHYNYVSLDVNEDSLATLQRLLESKITFDVITAEHEANNYGDTIRVPMRKLLSDYGYAMYYGNVRGWFGGCQIEDWWVNPTLKGRQINGNFVWL